MRTGTRPNRSNYRVETALLEVVAPAVTQLLDPLIISDYTEGIRAFLYIQSYISARLRAGGPRGHRPTFGRSLSSLQVLHSRSIRRFSLGSKSLFAVSSTAGSVGTRLMAFILLCA